MEGDAIRKVVANAQAVGRMTLVNEDLRGAAAEVLREELSKEENSNVKEVTMVCCKVSLEAGVILGEMLGKRKNISLSHLTFMGCVVQDDETVAHIARGVMESKHLVAFKLLVEHGMTGACGGVLEQMLKANKSLKELLIGSSALKEAIVKITEVALEEQRITNLHITLVDVSLETCKKITELLRRQNKCLERLRLRFATLDQQGVKNLADMLREDKRLEHVSFFGCNLEDEGIKLLAEALQKNRSIKMFDVTSVSFGAVGGKALGAMVKQNNTLEALVVGCNDRMSGECCKEICEGIKTNKTLTTADFRGCHMEGNDFEAIGALLRSNSTLKTVEAHTSSLINPCEAEIEAMIGALEGHESIEELTWPVLSSEAEQRIANMLLAKNGSLVRGNKRTNEICKRNVKMHQRAREAVQTLRILGLGKIPKDVVKMIARYVWKSRTQVDVWKEK